MLRHRFIVALLIVAGVAAAASAQQAQPAPVPRFDAVSIRPCPDPRMHLGPGDVYPPRGTSTPGHLRTGCFPLLDDNGMGLIRGAYADTFTPINSGPGWIHSAFYEIDAIADGEPSVKTMMGPMMQALLEDRFHLRLHRQLAEGAVYLLAIARGGPKLQSFVAGNCTPYSTMPPPPLPAGQHYCDSLIGGGSPAHVEDEGVTLDDFAKQLLGVLGRPVVNQTGLAGRFDIRMEFSREGTRLAGLSLAPFSPGSGSPTASDPAAPLSIFTAVQDDLGLKLTPGKGQVETLTIDHIERPSAN